MISSETVSGSPVSARSLRASCSRDDLSASLGVVARGVSARATVQILSGVLVSAEGGRLLLAATDMEISLRASLEAEVESEGAVVVPGRLLVDLVRLLPDDQVVLEKSAEEGTLRITCGAASYAVHTYDAEDFPRLPELAPTALSRLDAGAFLQTVVRVSRSVSRDESRPVLTGILVRFEEGKLVMAATDSYRLSVKQTPLEDAPPDLEAIVPSRALAELGRIVAGERSLELGVQDNQVVFHSEGVWLTSRRIDGQFPNYRQLLPESFEHDVVLRRDEFLDVVRRVAVMAQRNSPLRLRFASGEVTVSAQTQDVGEAREVLPVPFAGEPLEIGFNADFLREGIESVAADELTLRLISPLRPGLIEVPEEGFWYLIMPIRLAG